MFKFKTISAIFGGIGLMTLILISQHPHLWYLFPIFMMGFIAVVALGVFNISLGFFGPNISKLKTHNTEILLTFDDGPDPTYTVAILKILKKYNCKAIFFCIGQKIQQYPDIARQIVHEGHWIGNHTFTHELSFTNLPSSYLQQQLSQTEDALAALGIPSNRIFRPPFGVTNPSIAKAARALNLSTIGWSKRSLDTVIFDPSQVLKRVTKGLKSGDIILFHDTMAVTHAVLDAFLQEALQKGFTLDGLEVLKSTLKK